MWHAGWHNIDALFMFETDQSSIAVRPIIHIGLCRTSNRLYTNSGLNITQHISENLILRLLKQKREQFNVKYSKHQK